MMPATTLPPRARILLVDDVPTNIHILNGIFKDLYEVRMATSGSQALELCRTHPPDLVLLDILMPGIGGLEVCRALKNDPLTREIPVIFVTSHNDPEQETRGLEAGAVDFISKPVNAAVVLARVRTHLTLKNQADLLRSLAFLDGLTGLQNRRRFDEVLELEWSRCRRTGMPLSLLMIDVDHFKAFNDTYGHPAGDSCLMAVAQVLRDRFQRGEDFVARYGGEEFVALVPNLDAKAVLTLARGIVAAVAALALPHETSATAPVVTISLGLATTVPLPGQKAAELLSRADNFLYLAKELGRNQTQSAMDTPPSGL